jgi:hypothetical protein
LRGLILQNLGDDQSQIPPHIVLKVKERIATALKKNASMDSERYSTLTGMLEFFDLRGSRRHDSRKGTMDALRGHFQQQGITRKEVDQLAKLGNGIRHSRSVSEIMRMEGEASLLWFTQVLAK